jgi:pSer/pThr/pTyr-binding forkhead associated (FHA) protein
VGTGVVEAAVTLRLQDGTLQQVGNRLRMGRNLDNELVLNDPQVSGGHAEIRRGENEVVLVDLGSSNGTFVNEVAVTAPQTLRHNDVIRMGATEMTLVLQVMEPRSQTGPVGLPDEPLERPQTSTGVIAELTWNGRRFEIVEDMFQIGRDNEGAQVTLEDPAASWLHAEVTRHGDTLYLRDLGSRNGSYVNGELVAVPHPLRDGDVIHVGNTDLIFHSSTGPTAGTAPIPAKQPSSIRRGAGLLCTEGRFLGVWFAIKGRSATVGRDPSCDLTIPDLTVSRRHAELRLDGDQWRISDLGSTNGTSVAGEPVERGAWVTVSIGDEIELGNIAVTLSDRQSAPSSVREAPAADSAKAGPSERTAVISAPRETEEALVEKPPPRPEEPEVTAFLVISGPSQGRELPLPDLPLVIGREDATDVLGLGDGYISSRHLSIDRGEEGGVEVTDLGSTNGTWLGEEQLSPNTPTRISRGDKLRLGPITILEAD